MGAEIGLVNAGALRASLPAVDLRYGQLYEAMPFDDGLAVVRMSGADLLAVAFRPLLLPARRSPRWPASSSTARRRAPAPGSPIDPARTYTVAMNEFLAEGGDGLRGVLARLPAGSKTIRGDLRLRDATVAWLRTAPEALRGLPCP